MIGLQVLTRMANKRLPLPHTVWSRQQCQNPSGLTQIICDSLEQSGQPSGLVPLPLCIHVLISHIMSLRKLMTLTKL